MEKLKIGNITLKNRLFLSPMVDVTDVAYRLICRDSGCGIAYTEMLHVESILHGGATIQKKMITSQKEHPVGIQITAKKAADIKPVINKLEKFDLIDINCGCPSHLTIDHGSGSYLLKKPEKIGEMIRLLKDKTDKPITAKIRLGFRKNNVLKTAKIIEKSGADLLTVHARLASEGRSIPADWNELKKLRKHLGIPLIGNGDVFTPKKSEEMLDICDGVMIARGALGNPNIFSDCIYYLKTGKSREFNLKKNIKYFIEYLRLIKKYDIIEVGRIKYIGSNFIKDFPGAAKSRGEFMKLKSYEEIMKFFEGLEN